jgi:hypothetical protein
MRSSKLHRLVRKLDTQDPEGGIRILGYPESVFPPTDFHTATLIERRVYIIGSLGYPGTRRHGETPIYRLSVDTFQIERVDARGDAPGWLYGHRAILCSAHEIPCFRREGRQPGRRQGGARRQRALLRARHEAAGLALRSSLTHR